jgi:hypothetical protein
MSLIDSVRTALEIEPSGRKTRFGAHYRDQAAAAAEAAQTALQGLQRYSEDRLEIEGLVNGARNLVEHAQATVYETAERAQTTVAEADALNQATMERIRDAAAELERRHASLLGLQADVEQMLKDAREELTITRNDMKNEVGSLRAEVQRHRRYIDPEERKTNDRSSRNPGKP